MTFRAKQITLIALAIVLLLGLVLVVYKPRVSEETPVPTPEPVVVEPEPIPEDPRIATVGASVSGRPIESYTFGSGDTHLLFVGGVHGGYEWNSVLLAYEFIDHLTQEGNAVPSDLTVSIIPNLNPDGTFRVIGKEGRFTLADVPVGIDTSIGRFNENNVDLNRNFDCKWQPKSTWRGNIVSAGTAPFSEPEAEALRAVVSDFSPIGVVFWHSKANAVYASECHDGILPGTRTLMETYANAAGYTTVDVFDAYPVTGDAEGWLASIGIPAITVELATHESLEWERNLAGLNATLSSYRVAK